MSEGLVALVLLMLLAVVYGFYTKDKNNLRVSIIVGCIFAILGYLIIKI